jgi:hypothetical protein
LAEHFGVPADRHKTVKFDYATYVAIMRDFRPWFHWEAIQGVETPGETTIPTGDYDYAYHHLMIELVQLQVARIRTAVGGTKVKKLFIDGGFSDNAIFLALLSHNFRELSLRTTDSSLGSALGAALAISDTSLNPNFLKKNYALKKHLPFIVKESGSSPLETSTS